MVKLGETFPAFPTWRQPLHIIITPRDRYSDLCVVTTKMGLDGTKGGQSHSAHLYFCEGGWQQPGNSAPSSTYRMGRDVPYFGGRPTTSPKECGLGWSSAQRQPPSPLNAPHSSVHLIWILALGMFVGNVDFRATYVLAL